MAFAPTIHHPKVHDGPSAGTQGAARPAQAIRYAVIHATESGPGSAAAVANYFHNLRPPDYGSTQLVVDDASVYRCVADLVTPYGAPPLNGNGVHVEQCGYSSWSRKEWLQHKATIEHTAYHVAKWCHHYHIPVKWRTRIGLALGRKGITSHNAVSKAFKVSNHTDPGLRYPRRYFMRCVRFYYGRL